VLRKLYTFPKRKATDVLEYGHHAEVCDLNACERKIRLNMGHVTAIMSKLSYEKVSQTLR
jgi:hypothetical protein